MATLNITQHMTMTLADGTELKLGDLATPKTLTLTNGTKFEIIDVIADDFGQDVLWTTGEGGMDTFEVMLVYSDADIWLEFRTDLGAGAQFIIHKLQGGVWHLLTSDDLASAAATVLDGAVLVDDTDFAQIDRIEAYRDAVADAGDAIVHLILLG